MPFPIALTIAGSDPSGGAGLQADLKTFHRFGVYGMSVVSLLTVQNTLGVQEVVPLAPDLVVRQLKALLHDPGAQALKTGALGSAAIIEAIAPVLAQAARPLVVDPVLISKGGQELLLQGALEAQRARAQDEWAGNSPHDGVASSSLEAQRARAQDEWAGNSPHDGVASSSLEAQRARAQDEWAGNSPHDGVASPSLEALQAHLLPLATLLTPNLPEAQALLGQPIRDLSEAREAARLLAERGPRAVLLKGGHFEAEEATDVLWDGQALHLLREPRIPSKHTHGTGCTLAAAVTALLARGVPLLEAVARAKRFVARAIASAPGIGQGIGPLNHWAPDA